MSTASALEPRAIAAHRAPLPGPGNMVDLLGRLARRDPEAPVVHERTPDGLVAVSRGELWRRTCALADDLREHGVAAGDAVVVWLPNWSDVLVWQCAVASRGAYVVGVNTRYGADEVTHVLVRVRPRLIAVAYDFHGLDLVGRLRVAVHASGVTPQVALVAGPGRPTPDPAGADVGSAVWTPGRVDGPPPAPGDPHRLAVGFTTSGSTGLPKLAAHTGAGVLAHAGAGAGALGLTEGDVVLGALPLSGVFGYNAVLAALVAGASTLLEPVFEAVTVLDDMVAVGVTHVASGDDLVLRLSEAWQAHRVDLSSWRWWGVADFQGRTDELASWLDAEFGTAVAGVYGSSEVFALTATWPLSEPTPRRWVGGGRVVHPSIAVRTADPVTDEVLAYGVEGELQFRGPNVVDAYLGDHPDTTTRDGWFRTGDLGVLVDDGAFAYVCRMGDALRLRGFLVDPAEIEVRLAAHPQVHTAKVVGATREDGATEAVGFVTLTSPTATIGDLREWCRATLAPFKVPATVHVLDEMPTTAGTNGLKIRTEALREYARDPASQSPR